MVFLVASSEFLFSFLCTESNKSTGTSEGTVTAIHSSRGRWTVEVFLVLVTGLSLDLGSTRYDLNCCILPM